MRRSPLIALLALVGCVSAGTPEPAAAPPRVLSSGGFYDVRVSSNDEASLQEIRATPDEAWRALPQVFEALEIPLTHVESTKRLMGNPDYSARRELGGRQLESYLNCGSSITGPITSNHRVKLSLLVQVLPGDQGMARLSSRVEGRAQSRQGVSGSVLPCGSTGQLEARVAQLLELALQR